MKKLFFSLFLVPALTAAQPVTVNKPVLCEDLDKLVPILQERSKEAVEWVGITPRASIALTVNKETLTWTLIEFDVRENIGCIIGFGRGYSKSDTAPKSAPPDKDRQVKKF